MNALILVDIQNDFLSTGGALPVPDGDAVIGVANRAAHHAMFDIVVATQHWHPRKHGSFAANHADRNPGDVIDLDGLEQILWPVHCVQRTWGADFAPALDLDRVLLMFQKGTHPRIDSYSGFFDNGQRKATGLEEFLRKRGVTHVFVLGIATDYCVKFTALDARRLGFDATLIANGCRAMDRHPGDGQRAIEMMREAGVKIAADVT